MYRLLLRGKSKEKSQKYSTMQLVLPDNSSANVIITTNLPSEDNSAFTAGSTGIIEQGIAESRQRTSLSLSLKRPHG